MPIKRSLSAADREILGILKEEGRIRWTDLGRRTGVSRVAVQNRVEALERAGWIAGYTVRLGQPIHTERGVQAFLRIRFERGHDCFTMFERFGRDGIVKGGWALAGDWDAKLHLHAGDLEEISAFRELIVAAGGIDEIETEVVMNDLSRMTLTEAG